MSTHLEFISKEAIVRDMLADTNFYKGYSRWSESHQRYETWDEAVARVMNMHRQKYAEKMTPALAAKIDFAEMAYREKLILGAQRALQFGGDQIVKHNARLYNCSFSYVDRPAFFQEAMYLLLSGCGVGFSVQRHHVARLPKIKAPSPTEARVFQIPDSIEGWADAFAVLLSSYWDQSAPFPDYQGKIVHFDASQIRPRGSFISGGFKAPGASGLMEALEKCRKLLDQVTRDHAQAIQLRPIHAYDFVMHMSDAVLSGGIRRAATICLFSKDDEEMMMAKTGDWFHTNPQRARSNNSALLIRDELTAEEFHHLMESAKHYGEPGFIFADDTEFGFNPCAEIGMRAYTEDGRSGFQFCNLTEINGARCSDRETLLNAAKASAILGTLQAGYTDFHYLESASREITEREALLGCSITGWMSRPEILFDEQNMLDAARMAVETNQEMAALLGINPAARVTTVKPSGNASVLLGCASGIHGEHAPRYFRNMQVTDTDEVARLIQTSNPKMIERSVWSQSGTDWVVSFPIVPLEGSIYKEELLGVKQLEYVKKAQQAWIEAGTVVERCVDPRLRHNVSNTITVDDWAEVEAYIYANRHVFAGISLLSAFGDRAYPQAPFTRVFTEQEIVDMYGVAGIFASGLIVDGLHAFENNLWTACDTVLGHGLKLSEEESSHLLKRDWVRRARQFADKHFGGDLLKMCNALKDVNNLHKWESIMSRLQPIRFTEVLSEKKFTEVNTLGAQACSGGACEISFG